MTVEPVDSVCGCPAWWVDLGFRGIPRIIGAAVIASEQEVVVVDPGPAATLDVLERSIALHGLSIDCVTRVLLTHVHLDHAGATGALIQRNPAIEVFVHESGAPHLVDPSRLVESADRLYGGNAEGVWGAVIPVPETRVRTLAGGESIPVGNGRLEVAYTPGHARHHVAYLDASSGCAFVGDVAGVRIDDGPVILPTPPPDVNLEHWHRSLNLIQEWRPSRLFLTHFGAVRDVVAHLEEVRASMAMMVALTRDLLAAQGTDGDAATVFADTLRLRWSGPSVERLARAYEAVAPPEMLWLGLSRYWRQEISRVS